MKYTLAVLILLTVPTIVFAVSVNPDGREVPGSMVGQDSTTTNSAIDDGQAIPSVRRLQDAREQVNQVNERAEEVESRALEIQQQSQERVTEVRQQLEERQVDREQRLEQTCQIAEQRIQNQIRRYDIIKANHQARNQRVVTRLNEIMLRLESEGIDVTELRTAIQGLQTTVNSFEVSAQDYINLLIESENFACGQSEGEFLSRIRSAREKAPQIRSNVLSVREYFQAEIRPELEAIKVQLEAKKSAEQSETTPSGIPIEATDPSQQGQGSSELLTTP